MPFFDLHPALAICMSLVICSPKGEYLDFKVLIEQCLKELNERAFPDISCFDNLVDHLELFFIQQHRLIHKCIELWIGVCEN